jgi:aryl-alcohol dehydrogenase-like predicted oxidoreductase
MEQRTLGPGGPEVSALGLGCMSMSMAYGTPDRASSEATLRRALELGINFFDTANVYGNGHNEELLGEVLEADRSRIVLATKFGILFGESGPVGLDGRPDHVASYCEESLRRLRTDSIDLYYLHRVDPEVPVAETVGAMARLVEAGKVRCLGLSEVNSATLRRAHEIHPITAVQSEYSLWTRDPEAGLLDTCRELGVAFVPFSPLGRGMLTGSLTSPAELESSDMRRRFPRFQAEHFEHNRALVDALSRLAEAKGCRPAQLALAWVMAQGEHVVPIPGTKRVARLEENAGAASVRLSPAELERLASIFAQEAISGDRYPPAMMGSVQRETATPR